MMSNFTGSKFEKPVRLVVPHASAEGFACLNLRRCPYRIAKSMCVPRRAGQQTSPAAKKHQLLNPTVLLR
jgi:hypothetical protein